MADICRIVEDHAEATDQAVSGMLVTIIDTASAVDSAVGVAVRSVTDTAESTDSAARGGTRRVLDTAAATDAATGGADVLRVVVDTADAFDAAEGGTARSVVDTAECTDAASSQTGRDVIDTAGALDAADRTQVVIRVVLDTAVAVDAAVPLYVRQVLDTAECTDAATTSSRFTRSVAESFLATDSASASSTWTQDIVDTAGATDWVARSSTTIRMVVDYAIAEDHADTGRAGVIWSVPGDSLAMSYWTGQPWNSIAEVHGRLLAAGDDGVFEFVAGAGSVVSRIEGAESDLGHPGLQRPLYAYLAARGDTSLRLSLIEQDSGEDRTGVATFAPRPAQRHVANRTSLPQGLRSRFWRWTLDNPTGGDFHLTELNLTMNPLQRRV